MVAAPANRRSLAPLLAGLAMFGPFAIDTMFPAFPAIGAQLLASPVAMQQTLSVYMIAYALMSLLHGPLSDALGRRRVILVGVAVFTAASVGCALSTSITELLAYRAMQGMSAGAGMIVGRAIIRDCFDGAAAQRLMSSVSMIFGIAPAIAPIIGGWIIAFAHWSMIFWFLAAFAGLLWIACLALLPETHPRESRNALSLRAMAKTYGLILRDPVFLPLVFAGTLGFNALFVYISSAPAFVIGLLGLDAQQFAWLFIPAIGGLMLGSFTSGRLAGRVSGTATIRLGYTIMLGASAFNIATTLLLARPMVPWSVLPIGLHAIGIGIAFPTLTLNLLDRFPRHRGGASSMQAFFSLVMSAILAGVVSPLVSGSSLKLALTAAAITATGFVAWRLCRVFERRIPAQVDVQT
ncbi:MAG TPA: multidrug effflux MFS transporter [Dokdonella sp.]|uniref:multidrug effflux MFS transporter n=1 Tax=Dokdonella sp. TaxID=2291710 RepID=UPI002C654D7F|nr:multidrug effflux MFS transporter [Xanthomonadales bacterium]HQV72212.1 multidrug effflux MFS transporter [Dokdonella sp.]MBL0221193.1 multidrug effflux MFS transporter [Xanthomonadales bacterium]HQW76773.1 multidrug effflux MFS transporter [Dokdonella sp.]HQX65599.1 multidrug effflux MFS transporter [Dokdonella sp.]